MRRFGRGDERDAEIRKRTSSVSATVIYFVLLAAGEIVVFFNDPGHFFQADTIYWLYRRYHSLPEFIGGFIRLDPGGWYRPLSNRVVESVLFPLVGLNPAPYRLVTFGMFFACTVSVFVLVKRLTHSRGASWIATIFFATHITNAYTTYDVAFTPELAFTFFYMAAVIAYLSHLRTHSRKALLGSVAFFIAGLFSKETAVTLPATLLAVYLLVKGLHRRSLIEAVRSVWVHLLVMIVYLVFVIGYLRVGGVDITTVFQRPEIVETGSYNLIVDEGIPQNMDIAATWIFNIPREWHGAWQQPKPWMLGFLKVFRMLTCGLVLMALFTKQRPLILFGLSWFLIAAAPALPLVNHFLPYYLFAPLVGFALIVGVSFQWAREQLAKQSPAMASVMVAIPFALLAYVNAQGIWNTARGHPLLGGSSANALRTINDLKAMHPDLAPNTRLVFLNDENPSLWSDHGQDGLVRMVYGDETIISKYSTNYWDVDQNDFRDGSILVFELKGGHLYEATPAVLRDPGAAFPMVSDERYGVDPPQMATQAGDTAHSIRVWGLSGQSARVMYTFNEATLETLEIPVDSSGQAMFPGEGDVRRGTYRFIAVRIPGQPQWARVNTVIAVR